MISTLEEYVRLIGEEKPTKVNKGTVDESAMESQSSERALHREHFTSLGKFSQHKRHIHTYICIERRLNRFLKHNPLVGKIH